jgi:hypothetical protein
MGGRHQGPDSGTDLFMAAVIVALLTVLAAVIVLALVSG